MEPGKEFELEVFSTLKRLVREGEFGLSPENAQVFHRKAYYSKDRKADIITDVSIEVTRQDSEVPWLIWIWECRDHKDPIKVGAVEAFHSKLQQIGSSRTKGTLISTSTFQRSAVTLAKAHGIGLQRRIPDGSIIRLCESVRELPFEHIERALSEEPTEELESLTYALSTTGRGVMSWDALFAVENEGLAI